MSAISLIGHIIKALTENNQRPQSRPNGHLRQVPVEHLKTLIKNGRKQDAVIMLVKTMNWSPARALEFVESISGQANKNVGNTNIKRNEMKSNPSRNRTSTQIDSILRDQQMHEAKGGGSILDFFRKKFGK